MTPKAISDVNRSERLIEDLREFSGMLLRDPKYRYAPQLMIDAADELARLRVDAERFQFLMSEVERRDSDYNIFPYDWDQCRNSKDYWTIRGPLYDKRSFVQALDDDMAAATPKQVADSSGRAEEEDHERSRS